MRRFIICLFLIALPSAASADIGEFCDLLRADPEINLPAMPKAECQHRFMVMGAHWYSARNYERLKALQDRQAKRAKRLADEASLPMPAPGPTTTPTATATATSTPAP